MCVCVCVCVCLPLCKSFLFAESYYFRHNGTQSNRCFFFYYYFVYQ